MDNHLELILENSLSTDVPLNLTEIINKFDGAVIETGDSETVPYYKDGHYHITVPKNETVRTNPIKD